MSGSKRITIDQNAWQQAQQAAERLRQVNRDLPGMVEALRRQQEDQANRTAAEMRARQDQVDAALAGLSEQARRMEAETSRKIRAREAVVRREMAQAVQSVRQESRTALEDQERRFQQDLAREQRDRKEAFRDLQTGLTRLQQGRDQAAGAASAVAGDARLLRDTISQNLPHQQFAPGRLDSLGKRMATADGNLAQGLGEAALAQYQQLYLELSELRVEVELRSQEWEVARLAATSAVTVLQEQLSLSASLDVSDQDGQQIEGAKLDVDFWSEGELTELRTEVDALAARISAAEPLTLAELRAICDQDAPAMEERLTNAVALAYARQLGSQVRVNVAEMVVTTLEQTAGYVWEDGAAIYANGDERRAFYSKLRGVDDSEIVIEVAPDEKGESCVLRILSYDVGDPDEEARVRRAHAIADSLRARGLAIGAPAAEDAPPDPQLTDFDRLRQPVARPQQVRAGSPTASQERG